MRTKMSAGLICLRHNQKKSCYEALLVRGRFSYAFTDFVFGHYGARGPSAQELITQMSINERMLLQTCNFEAIWQMMWGRTSTQLQTPHVERICKNIRARSPYEEYAHKKGLFEERWMRDGGRALQGHIATARGAGTGDRWDIPKGGRQHRSEALLACALREFREETDIPLSHLHVFPGFTYVHTYQQAMVKYVIYYYVALLVRPVMSPARGLSLQKPSQAHEVDDIAWVAIKDLQHYRSANGQVLSPMIGSALNYVKARNGTGKKIGERSLFAGWELSLTAPPAGESRPPAAARSPASAPTARAGGARSPCPPPRSL